MVTRNVSVVITGNPAQLKAALAASAVAADETGGAIGDSFEAGSTKAGSAMDRLGQKLQSLGIPGAAAFSKIGSGISEADTKGQKLGQTLSTAGGLALGAGVAGLVAFGAESVKNADAFDTAQAGLQTAVKNSGNSFDALKPKLNDAYTRMSSLGFNSTETATAIGQLTTATGSPTKAITDLGTAANLARLKHISLSDASGVLTKTMAGSTRALTSLGLNLDIGSAKLSSAHSATVALSNAQEAQRQVQEKVDAGTIKGLAAMQATVNANRAVQTATDNLSRDQNAAGSIMDALNAKTKGAADTYGKTLGGQLEIAKAKVHNLSTDFGEFLIPKITEAITVVTKIVTWFSKHKTAAEALAAVIGGVLAIAIAAFAINMGTKFVKSISSAVESLGKLGTKLLSIIPGFGEVDAAAETTGETMETAGEEGGAGMDSLLGPIGAVIIIGTLLVTHWKQVLGYLEDTWNAIKSAATTVWDFILNHLKDIGEGILIAITGPIGILVIELMNHWTTVKQDAVGAWNDIVGFFTGIPDKVVAAITTLGSDIAGVATRAWSAFSAAVSAGWNAEVSFWTSLPGRIVGALGDAGSKLASWGSNLVGGMVSGIGSAASKIGDALVSAIKNGWDAAKSAINSIPVIGSVLSHIPGLATGGYVTSPTLALVGEAGPEFVIPESQLYSQFAAGIQPLPGSLAGSGITTPSAAAAAGVSSTGRGDTNINITGVPITDANAIAAEVGWALRTAPVT